MNPPSSPGEGVTDFYILVCQHCQSEINISPVMKQIEREAWNKAVEKAEDIFLKFYMNDHSIASLVMLREIRALTKKDVKLPGGEA